MVNSVFHEIERVNERAVTIIHRDGFFYFFSSPISSSIPSVAGFSMR